MFNLPAVVLLLIALFVAVFVVQDYMLSPEKKWDVLKEFAFVPTRVTMLFDAQGVSDALAKVTTAGQMQLVAQFLLGDGSLKPWTILTYAFLHGDVLHLTMNSLWLVIFGAPVARRFGTARFLLLFAITAVAGVALHLVFHRFDFLPVVGASAAVSGAMAASLRFIFQPGAPLGPRVAGLRLPPAIASRLPALGLRDVLRDKRVMQFTGIWFVINLLFGLYSFQLGATSGMVAWEAHVGGFVAGFLLFQLLDPPPVDPDTLARYLRPSLEEMG